MNVVLIPTYTVNTGMQFADNLYLDVLEVESISVVVLLLLKQQTKFLRRYSIVELWTAVFLNIGFPISFCRLLTKVPSL